MTTEEYRKAATEAADLLEQLTTSNAAMSNRITKDAKERLASSDLFSSPLNHLVVLHRVIYGTIEPELALAYLHQHLRDDEDLADMGRPLKYQYQENARHQRHLPAEATPENHNQRDSG